MKLKNIYFTLIVSSFFFLSSAAQQSPDKSLVKVYGEVKKPLNLSLDDLSKMKRVDASLKDHDGKVQTYTGVAVQDILAEAGAPMGKELRGENLAKYLLVKCADGYQVVIALAEIDNGFTDNVIILADGVSGQPLPKEKGPFRLIVPGEKRPARSSYQVIEMEVKSASQN
ncbi:MAG: molybdopterin-dependent oxidoreductase [Chitinophagaceae bacterium]|nr:molybdopterin-dependent oxidoreductase [Chitinophagaceae bacterium]